MIRKTLGAAFIAGSALTIYNTDSAGPIIDNLVTEAAASIDVPSEIKQNKEALMLGGGVLGLLLGVSMVSGAAIGRMKKKHAIHPDVEAELNRKLSIMAGMIGEKFDKSAGKVRKSNIAIIDTLAELTKKMRKVDQTIAGELSIDISALEQAASEMGNVEGASERVLAILEKIENTANTHIALNTPEGAMERYSEAKDTYSKKQENLRTTALKAATHSGAYTAIYPEHFNDIIWKATVLDTVIQSTDYTDAEFKNVIQDLNDTVSNHTIMILGELKRNGTDKGTSRQLLAAVSEQSSSLILAANEYVAASSALKAITEPTLPQPSNDIEDLNLAELCDQKPDNIEGYEINEDGMIEVPGYGAIALDPNAPQL